MSIRKKAKSFELTSLFVFIASIAASAGNYLFQILMGRILDAESYGGLYAVLSITNIAMIFGSAASTVIAKNIASAQIYDKSGERKIMVGNAVLQSGIAAVTFVILLVTGYDIVLTLCATAAVLSTNIAISWYGLAQGKKAFAIVAIYNLIHPVTKIALAVPIVKAGANYFIVFIVMTVSALISIFLCHLLLVKANKKIEKGSDDNLFGNTKKSFFASIVPMLALSVYSNIHVIVFEKFAGGAEAGAFSVAAVFGNALLYIPSAIAVVLVPFVAGSDNKTQRALLVKSLVYSESLAVLCAILLILLRKPVLSLLFGPNGAAAEMYLLPVCIMAIPIIAIFVLTNYLIAKGENRFLNIVGIVSFVILAVGIILTKSNMLSMLIFVTVLYAATAFSLIIKEVINHVKERKNCLFYRDHS